MNPDIVRENISPTSTEMWRKKQTVKSLGFLLGQTLLLALVLTTCSYAVFGRTKNSVVGNVTENVSLSEDTNLQLCLESWIMENGIFSNVLTFKTFISTILLEVNMINSTTELEKMNISNNSCFIIKTIASTMLLGDRRKRAHVIECRLEQNTDASEKKEESREYIVMQEEEEEEEEKEEENYTNKYMNTRQIQTIID